MLMRTLLVSGFMSVLVSCSCERPATYRADQLVQGVPMHAVHGMAFGSDGALYAGSVIGQSIHRIDVGTGEVSTVVAAPDGEADDLAFGPGDMLAWTALIAGEVRAQRAGGKPYVLAADLPLVNPIAFDRNGRLFVARIGVDRLYEIYVDNSAPPRLIAEGLGQLNGFEFGDDGKLYGPLPTQGAMARIDVDSGEVEQLATNMGQVVGVDIDSAGRLYAVQWESGEIFRIPAGGGIATQFAQLEPPLDNIVVGPADTVYVSQPSRNGVVAVAQDGSTTQIVGSTLVAPGGLSWVERKGEESLLVADAFGFRFVDTQTGELLGSPAGLTGGSSDVAVNGQLIALSYVRRGRVSLWDKDSSELLHTWENIGAPYGVVIDGDDALVVDFAAGQLLRLKRNPDNREVIASDLAGPVGLAWAGPNSVYISEALAGRVLRLNLGSGATQVIADGLQQPEGLAVLADGNVVVAEAAAGRLTLVDIQSASTLVIADGLDLGTIVSRAPAPVHLPTGVAVGPDGAIYVTEDRTNSIRKLIRQ